MIPRIFVNKITFNDGTTLEFGRHAIPQGNASRACDRLLRACRTAGLHVVEVGELERFIQTIPHHGPAWVLEVIKRDVLADPELREAREYVARLIAS